MGKNSLSGPNLIQDAASHFGICQVVIARLYEFWRCCFQTSAPNRNAMDQQVDSFCMLDQVRCVNRIAGKHDSMAAIVDSIAVGRSCMAVIHQESCNLDA